MDWAPGSHITGRGGGTGDIAFRYRERGGGPVIVCDINEAMLAVGRERAAENGSRTLPGPSAMPRYCRSKTTLSISTPSLSDPECHRY